MNLIDELTSSYLNKCADAELGKNIEEHYIDVSTTIHTINALMDTSQLEDDERLAFGNLAYSYYRLKERLLEAMILIQQQ